MPKYVIEKGSLKNESKDGRIIGFCFGVRLPGYRGNMLSLVNGYYLNVDGEEYPQDSMKLEINGKPPRTFEELKSAVWEHWDYTTTACLHVEKEGGLAPGIHNIHAVINNFEQYGYSIHDEDRVEKGEIPTAVETGYHPSRPQELEIR